jgi:AraC family transcriptional regulator of adaptative response/methylated-DNA-[protein]-cysteine methyltransferase
MPAKESRSRHVTPARRQGVKESRSHDVTETARLDVGARQRKGNKLDRIRYTTTECQLGCLLVAATDKGVCAVNLANSESELLEFLEHRFPSATPERDDAGLARWVQELLHSLSGAIPPPELPLDVRGTAFQQRVWNAMRKIPRGQTRTYRDVACLIGKPLAARAVARACALNPAMLVIPCHRVIGADGSVRGSPACKARREMLLEAERERG